MSVRTRFAPSPTGYLHIGGVRTAIFNWLFARRHGGQFILRIDDTDQTRHVEEALAPILHGFRWLGMQWDEGPEVGGPHSPYFQSQRGDKYRAAAARLVESGAAYPCFCTAAELDAEREAAKRAKRAYQYSKKCRGLSAAERERMRDDGRTSVIRFAVPPNRSVAFTDLILGPVGKATRDIGDFVIARADGSPLYNFASVVDDIDMQITHVIRAQEHLTNTYSQWLVFEALGGPMPAFAHVPYVAAPGSKEKISKRKLEPFRALMTPEIKQKFRDMGWRDEDAPNPVMMSYYEELGYLPDAMLNGLSRIGWSLDDKQEKISRGELLEHFTLERVNSAPASFDPDKLWWLQGEYMKELPIDQKIDGCIRWLQKARLIHDPDDAAQRDRIRRIVKATGDRLKVFSDIIPYGEIFFRMQLDPDLEKKLLEKEYLPTLLEKLPQMLVDDIEPFDVSTLETRIRQFSEAEGLKAAPVIHLLRAITSGRSVGPGVFELLAILGKKECFDRSDQTIRKLASAQVRRATPPGCPQLKWKVKFEIEPGLAQSERIGSYEFEVLGGKTTTEVCYTTDRFDEQLPQRLSPNEYAEESIARNHAAQIRRLLQERPNQAPAPVHLTFGPPTLLNQDELQAAGVKLTRAVGNTLKLRWKIFTPRA